ncbi:MAG: hypothetical protein VKK04_01275 [Synechococcales bacterium]|nr:hypothetical protein [Synechococcales bacterium]
MTDQPLIQITFGLDDPDLDDDQRLQFSKRVLDELRDLDEVERADRAEVLIPEEGVKGFETLLGFLTAEVTLPNLKDFAGWMGDRFSDQPMKLKVKVGEQEVELEAKSQKELAQVEQVAQKLLKTMKSDETRG